MMQIDPIIITSREIARRQGQVERDRYHALVCKMAWEKEKKLRRRTI